MRDRNASLIAPAKLLLWSGQQLRYEPGRPSRYTLLWSDVAAKRQVVVLERDPPMPPRSDKPQADGEEYTATMRSRNGSPQFMHGHIYLKRGWEVRSVFLCS